MQTQKNRDQNVCCLCQNVFGVTPVHIHWLVESGLKFWYDVVFNAGKFPKELIPVVSLIRLSQ
jgi:hypothetical protein